MSLFGNLPPIEPAGGERESPEQPAQSVQPTPSETKQPDGRESNAPAVKRPDFVPSLHRGKAKTKRTKPPGAPHGRALTEYLPTTICDSSNATNKKKTLHAPGHGGSIETETGFEPLAEYNPLEPNSYTQYKQWLRRQKRQMRDAHGRMLAEKTGAAVATLCVALDNMADELDEGLEQETLDECRGFGEVERCRATKTDAGEVRVFVWFGNVDAARRARAGLDGRAFDGRVIKATFVALKPPEHEKALLPAESKSNVSMSDTVAKVVATAASVMASGTPAIVDIFDNFGVIRPEFDDRTESEMSPADMFFLTMSLFLVGGCVSIVGGYYLNRALRSKSATETVKAAEKKKAANAAESKKDN
ncbi:hypothetical protein GGI07_004544 [Coemansia sp. Benny D115]|nr:hypothetical protein GGI07_004544 [Coemansia sp. Benny D115]